MNRADIGALAILTFVVILLAVVFGSMLAGCYDFDPVLPSCEELGCRDAPSGSDQTWTRCGDDFEVCYCGNPPEACTP